MCFTAQNKEAMSPLILQARLTLISKYSKCSILWNYNLRKLHCFLPMAISTFQSLSEYYNQFLLILQFLVSLRNTQRILQVGKKVFFLFFFNLICFAKYVTASLFITNIMEKVVSCGKKNSEFQNLAWLPTSLLPVSELQFFCHLIK